MRPHGSGCLFTSCLFVGRHAWRLALCAVVLAAQTVAATSDACTPLELLTNAHQHPWTRYWKPAPSELAKQNAVCWEVIVNTKVEDNTIQNLSAGLAQASGLTKLILNFRQATDIAWNSESMLELLATLKTVPIEDFELHPSERRGSLWPVDAFTSFLRSVPKATSLLLNFEGTELAEDPKTVGAWMGDLSTGLTSLIMNLQENKGLSTGVVDIFASAFGNHTSFTKLDSVAFDASRSSISGEDEIKLYEALFSGQYTNCSLVCDNITHVTDPSRAKLACAGKGNCNNPKPEPPAPDHPGSGNGHTVVVVVVILAVVLVFGSLVVYVRRRVQRRQMLGISSSDASDPRLMQHNRLMPDHRTISLQEQRTVHGRTD